MKFTHHPVTARVTGDTKNMHHPFPVGTEVRVIPDGSTMPPCTGSWRGEDETFFVHEADLELVTGDRASTIVDDHHDETSVRYDRNTGEIVVKVEAYATGVYNVEQARELRDALDRAITALEGPETYCLLDGDGDWWILTSSGSWAMIGNSDEPREGLASSVFEAERLTRAHPAAFQFHSGLDDVADIIEKYGIHA